ncbi:MAG: hypothetical protein R2737_06605 [Candidatus Nanopelagicales bacterium]
MTEDSAGSAGDRDEADPTLVVGDPAVVELALRWAAAEGWRPGRYDAGPFFAQDPDGFFGLRRGDELVATMSAVRYGEAFGFCGLYVTEPTERGRGYGTRLSEIGLRHVDDLPSVGLDGVVEREGLYASLGFVRAHLSRRWSVAVVASLVGASLVGAVGARSGASLVDADDVGVAAVGEYERRVRAFPGPREAFLRAWLEMPETSARVAVGASGRVLGYGVVRRCVTGAKIAPLFADDPDVAADLLDALLVLGAPWGEVSIDVPDPNELGVAMVQERGMTPAFACVRMYRGADPGLDLSRVFGLTSFELG